MNRHDLEGESRATEEEKAWAPTGDLSNLFYKDDGGELARSFRASHTKRCFLKILLGLLCIALLAYGSEAAWVGAGLAVFSCLLVVVARFVRRVFGRQIRDASAEGLWKASEDFHIEIKNDEDEAKSTPQNLTQ